MRLPFRSAALLLSAAVALAACTPAPPQTARSPAAASPAAPAAPASPASPVRSGCGSPVDTGPLPEWARAGFTGDSSMPHVLGDHGTIAAAISGYPLAVTRPATSSNKILWISKPTTPPGDLLIDATHAGTTESVQRRVPGGPGPSIIDLPQPGCWHLTLTWPGHTDTLDLTYAP